MLTNSGARDGLGDRRKSHRDVEVWQGSTLQMQKSSVDPVTCIE